MEKVTRMIEEGDDRILRQLSRAVRAIHGKRDPDLEQEAFIRTLEAFRRAKAVTHPEGLIWKVVRDTVTDHWRARRASPCDHVSDLSEALVSERPKPEEAIDRQRTLERLHRGIARLGCDIRGPVYLFYVEDYPIRTIARLYSKSTSAVKMALLRGRRQLERMYSESTK